MKNENKTGSSAWSWFAMLLQITFIILKLVGVIAWNWWWVLSPLWGTFVLVMVAIVVGVLLLGKE